MSGAVVRTGSNYVVLSDARDRSPTPPPPLVPSSSPPAGSSGSGTPANSFSTGSSTRPTPPSTAIQIFNSGSSSKSSNPNSSKTSQVTIIPPNPQDARAGSPATPFSGDSGKLILTSQDYRVAGVTPVGRASTSPTKKLNDSKNSINSTSSSADSHVSRTEEYLYNESNCALGVRVLVAAAFASVFFNIERLQPGNKINGFATNCGMLGASLLAFPVKGSCKWLKAGLSFAIGAVALFPRYYWNANEKEMAAITGLIYWVACSLMWNSSERSYESQGKNLIARTGGAGIAIAGHKGFQLGLSEPLASLFGNLFIGIGNLFAFPPEFKKATAKQLGLLTAVPIATSAVAAAYLKKSSIEAAIASIGFDAIILASLWYEGAKRIRDLHSPRYEQLLNKRPETDSTL